MHATKEKVCTYSEKDYTTKDPDARDERGRRRVIEHISGSRWGLDSIDLELGLKGRRRTGNRVAARKNVLYMMNTRDGP